MWKDKKLQKLAAKLSEKKKRTHVGFLADVKIPHTYRNYLKTNTTIVKDESEDILEDSITTI